MDTDEIPLVASSRFFRLQSATSETGHKKTIATFKHYFSEWRSGLAIATSAAALVTIINIVFLIAVYPRLKISPNYTGEGALYTGDCDTAKTYSIVLHLAINVLGTVLLGASNYMQQVLTGPTRHEIDRAHKRMQWLDIGILSFHNLGKISWKRVATWIILLLSSLPIHLLFNSVISFETGTNNFSVFTAGRNDVTNPDFLRLLGDIKNVSGEFQRLDKLECVNNYDKNYISGWGDVILMVNISSAPSYSYNLYKVSSLDGDRISSPYMEGDYSQVKNGLDWIVQVATVGYGSLNSTVTENLAKVEYCFAKQTEQYCKVIVNTHLLAIVIGFNIIKLLGSALTWFFLKHRPLLTIGDAIASFLERPDPETKDCHLLSKLCGHRLSWEPGSRIWIQRTYSWVEAVSLKVYVVTLLLCTAALFVASWLLSMALGAISNPTITELWNKGFGQVTGDTLISFGGDGTFENPIRMVLLSNLPQLIISMLYSGINGVWTTMLAEVEWNNYGTNHKGLRTTCPVGQQRKTYWLSLPLRYGVPLMVGSAALHWFISLSIFVVRLVSYDNGVPDDDHNSSNSIVTCGYSPIALIFAIILGSIILLTTIGGSIRKLTMAIPVGGHALLL